jgi:hypothetical protein
MTTFLSIQEYQVSGEKPNKSNFFGRKMDHMKKRNRLYWARHGNAVYK